MRSKKISAVKDTAIVVRVDSEQLNFLNYVCNELGESRSEYIRACIDYFMVYNCDWRKHRNENKTGDFNH